MGEGTGAGQEGRAAFRLSNVVATKPLSYRKKFKQEVELEDLTHISETPECLIPYVSPLRVGEFANKRFTFFVILTNDQ